LRPDTVRYSFAESPAEMGTQSPARIVLISEDEQLRSLLCGLLIAHGYAGAVGLDAAGADVAQLASCDVAIVDVSVHTDALRVLRALRGASRAGIIAVFSKTNGLAPELVALGDVLVGKPFDPRELVLIIGGLLHGKAAAPPAPQSRALVSAGPVSLSTLLNAAMVGAREVELTGVETRLLYELLTNASQPVTRERLTRRGLGRDWVPDDRSLDTHVNRLRRKLGNDRRGRTPIRTVRSVGYLLLAEWEPAP
jgi:two-component system OmpR family response regulator